MPNATAAWLPGETVSAFARIDGSASMLLMIDNYDSFTYNLVQYLGELGCRSKVVRNDMIDIARIERLAPSGIVISPGPCTPNEAGISVAAVRRFAPTTPILGICLGHQSICSAFGADVVRAEQVMHGKVSTIFHSGVGVLEHLSNPFQATRYHSLIAERASLPDCLEVTAWTDDDIIMGVRHRDYPVSGLQFHPESFLTPVGHDLLRNFLSQNAIAG